MRQVFILEFLGARAGTGFLLYVCLGQDLEPRSYQFTLRIDCEEMGPVGIKAETIHGQLRFAAQRSRYLGWFCIFGVDAA